MFSIPKRAVVYLDHKHPMLFIPQEELEKYGMDQCYPHESTLKELKDYPELKTLDRKTIEARYLEKGNGRMVYLEELQQDVEKYSVVPESLKSDKQWKLLSGEYYCQDWLICPECGKLYETTKNFTFCPKCAVRLEKDNV